MTTIDKVRLIERYLTLTGASADRTVDVVLGKLLDRKRAELERQREELRSELSALESRYGMSSAEFAGKFERGEVEDALDYFDWSATWQLYRKSEEYLSALADQQTVP